MKRWEIRLQKSVESKKIDDFIADIKAVYKKHNLSIAHEDSGGSLIIERLCKENIDWLEEANFVAEGDSK